MSYLRRPDLPVAITFLIGIFVTYSYFTDDKIVAAMSTEVQNIAIIMTSFALGMGAINLILLHMRRAREKKFGWWNSVLVIVVLAIVVPYGVAFTIRDSAYNFFFMNVYSPLDTAVFSFLGFYICSAMFRAFRIRNRDAAILMVAGILVMLKNIPLGSVIWEGFTDLGNWVMNVPNVAGTRGLTIGVAIGGIAIALRILFGLERRHLGTS